MILGISSVVWMLIGIAVLILIVVFAARRFTRYGGQRIMFLAPAAFLFSVFVLYPITGSVWLSLHDVKADRLICSDGRSISEAQGDPTCRRVPKMEFVGLKNYKKFFDKFPRDWKRSSREIDELLDGDPETKAKMPRASSEFKALINNIIWLLMFQIAIPIGLALAVLLNQTALFARILKPLYFFPFVISPAVIAFLFQFFYNPFEGGPLVGFYALLGLKQGYGILGTNGLSTFGVIIAAWYPQIAYCIIIYLAGLTAINPELIEAGKLDGARGFAMFSKIVLPQLWPATFICVVVTTIGALRSFDLVQVMTGGQRWSEVLARYMYETGFGEGGGDYGFGATVSVILFAIMLVFIVFFVTNMVRQTED